MKKSENRSFNSIGVWTFIIVFSFVAGWWLSHSKNTPSQPFDTESLTATVLDHGKPISEFQLVDHEGKEFTQNTFKGQWNLVYFGFTKCPYICPMTMREIKKTYENLTLSNGKPFPKVVMISVDPAHDTPELMKKYVKSFNKDFVGVTGDSKQIKKLSREMGVVYMQTQNKKNPKEYTIDHSGVILIVNPKGEVQGFFSMPHKNHVIAKEFVVIRDHFA